MTQSGRLLLLVIACISIFPVLSKAPADPVVMSVGPDKVRYSEFNYFRDRNRLVREFDPGLATDAEMYVSYRLKILDALSQRLDTVSYFSAELDRYAASLADSVSAGALDAGECAQLMREYREGILLYELSKKKLWTPVSDDQVLEDFFEPRRDNYAWSEIRFKGYLVMATNDSLAEEVVHWLSVTWIVPRGAELSQELRKMFGPDVRVETVLAPRGANAIVDYIAFGGPEPAPTGRWKSYAAARGRMIDRPETMSDVRARVANDFQLETETRWVDSLRQRYPVKINHKLLRRLSGQQK